MAYIHEVVDVLVCSGSGTSGNALYSRVRSLQQEMAYTHD